jgi:hypothetical protein
MKYYLITIRHQSKQGVVSYLTDIIRRHPIDYLKLLHEQSPTSRYAIIFYQEVTFEEYDKLYEELWYTNLQ